MRFPFRALPAASGGELTPRPVVDIALEGLPAAPMECLLDTGALRTRMSAELAPLAGIELHDAPAEDFFVAGLSPSQRLRRQGQCEKKFVQTCAWPRIQCLTCPRSRRGARRGASERRYRATAGDVQRLKRLVEPHPAALRNDKVLYGMQEVRGSNPLSSTHFSCTRSSKKETIK